MDKPEQIQAYKEWAKKPSKQQLANLLSTYDRLIKSEVNRYKGTLEPRLLESLSKKYIIDAIKSYKPSESQLSTHIVNNLMKLHRQNYQNMQAIKVPENIQIFLSKYKNAKALLEEELGREPTEDELEKKLGMKIKNIEKYMVYETPAQNLLYQNQYTETAPEDIALDLVYHDANDIDKKIIEYKTGYNNTPILGNLEIAKKLKISPVRISQLSKGLGNRIIDTLYKKDKYGTNGI